ncbi:MAG TPA: Crp/Fnr family transcriptional regulator [Rhodothermales bacterium]
MYPALRAYLNADGRFTEEQMAFAESVFALREIRKGEIIQRAGDVASGIYFVMLGCLRTYLIDDAGKEQTVQFLPENWWLSDHASATNRTAGRYFVDAVEASEVLVTDWPSAEKVLRAMPEMAEHYRGGLQRAQAAKERRIVTALHASAREKYLDFLEQYPTLALRVPLHMLASYLGITPETLSRVRATIK